MSTKDRQHIFQPQLAVVDFHHARGPEIEFWVSPDGEALYERNDWSLLPFMALSDGAHAMVEDFSYFTLLDKIDGLNEADQPKTDEILAKPRVENDVNASDRIKTTRDDAKPVAQLTTGINDTSLFGIACTRQIRSDRLKRRSADVTRSSVQKSVVVLVDNVKALGELRTRLGAATMAWFAQEDFSDISILKEFQESLVRTTANAHIGDDHHYFGLSLREMIYDFRSNTLVLFKCLLLQRKMLFFSSKCERLCLLQFALLSLIPSLQITMRDCAHPSLDNYTTIAAPQTSLRTSSRSSLLAYMGLPLHIFGKGSFFGPYTPLQHLDVLADYDTKSYVVGSTNSLLLQQRERYADILINLDEDPATGISIMSTSLRAALSLSAADRRWIDGLTQTVLDTWDPDNPGRPKNLGFAGSEEAIRLAFEEYLLGLVSVTAYQTHHEQLEKEATQIQEGRLGSDKEKENRHRGSSPHPLARVDSTEEEPEPDPIANAADYSPQFLALWRTTNNYALFHKLTAISLPPVWEVTPPRHPTAGGLSVEDVQRRLQQKMVELGIDEKVRGGREAVGKALEVGRDRVREGVGRFWREIERRRESSSNNNENDTSGSSIQSKPQTAISTPVGVAVEPVQTGEPGYPVYKRSSATSSLKSPVTSPSVPNFSKRFATGSASFSPTTATPTTHTESAATAPNVTNTNTSTENAAGTNNTRISLESSSTAASTANPTSPISSSSTNPTTTDPTSGQQQQQSSSTWNALLRDRASKVSSTVSTIQISKPDTTQLQVTARENAAKAGAYLSSWGQWAKEKSQGYSAGGVGGTDGGGGAGGGAGSGK